MESSSSTPYSVDNTQQLLAAIKKNNLDEVVELTQDGRAPLTFRVFQDAVTYGTHSMVAYLFELPGAKDIATSENLSTISLQGPIRALRLDVLDYLFQSILLPPVDFSRVIANSVPLAHLLTRNNLLHTQDDCLRVLVFLLRHGFVIKLSHLEYVLNFLDEDLAAHPATGAFFKLLLDNYLESASKQQIRIEQRKKNRLFASRFIPEELVRLAIQKGSLAAFKHLVRDRKSNVQEEDTSAAFPIVHPNAANEDMFAGTEFWMLGTAADPILLPGSGPILAYLVESVYKRAEIRHIFNENPEILEAYCSTQPEYVNDVFGNMKNQYDFEISLSRLSNTQLRILVTPFALFSFESSTHTLYHLSYQGDIIRQGGVSRRLLYQNRIALDVVLQPEEFLEDAVGVGSSHLALLLCAPQTHVAARMSYRRRVVLVPLVVGSLSFKNDWDDRYHGLPLLNLHLPPSVTPDNTNTREIASQRKCMHWEALDRAWLVCVGDRLAMCNQDPGDTPFFWALADIPDIGNEEGLGVAIFPDKKRSPILLPNDATSPEDRFAWQVFHPSLVERLCLPSSRNLEMLESLPCSLLFSPSSSSHLITHIPTSSQTSRIQLTMPATVLDHGLAKGQHIALPSSAQHLGRMHAVYNKNTHNGDFFISVFASNEPLEEMFSLAQQVHQAHALGTDVPDAVGILFNMQLLPSSGHLFLRQLYYARHPAWSKGVERVYAGRRELLARRPLTLSEPDVLIFLNTIAQEDGIPPSSLSLSLVSDDEWKSLH